MDKTPLKFQNPASREQGVIVTFILISFFFSIITGYYHHHVYINRIHWASIVENHLNVMEGKAEAPTQYRFVPHWITDRIYRASVELGAPADPDTLIKCYTGVRIVIMTLCNFLLLIFLRRWFDPMRCILGLLFTIAVNPLNEYMYYHQPADPWLYLIFLTGYILIVAGRDWWLAPVIFAGVLFKESAGLLIPAYIAARWGNTSWKKIVWNTVFMSVGFLVPYFLLRLRYGMLDNYMVDRIAGSGFTNLLQVNLANQDAWVVVFLYFNVLWFAVPMTWNSLPQVIRRMFLIVPLFFVLHILYAMLVEGRLFQAVLPLFLPSGLILLERLSKRNNIL